jgi:hypothetical protein
MKYLKEAINSQNLTEIDLSIINKFEGVLEVITDSDISFYFKHGNRKAKSISESIYKALEDYINTLSWNKNEPIFISDEITSNMWCLDYQKENVGIIISFGHQANIVKNITMSILATEDNQLEKKNNIEIMIILTVTNDMKKAGGFDGAVGSYEKYLESLIPMRSMIHSPLIIYGLKKPKSFYISNKQIVDIKKT